MKYLTLLLLLFALPSLGMAANSASANIKLSELKIQTEKIRKEIQEEEKIWAEEKNRESEAEKHRKERYEQFNIEKQDAQKALDLLAQQIKERMDATESLKIRQDNLSRQTQFFRTVILDEVRQYLAEVEKGFPYRQEKRTESTQLLIDDLVKERVSPEEGFNRLWVLYIAEHAAAAEAEIYSGHIDPGTGNSTAVKFLRVGKQVLAYMTPTGDHMGYLYKTKDGKWDYMRESSMDFDTRTLVRNAMAVAEGKAVPGFVSFPFLLNSFEEVQ